MPLSENEQRLLEQIERALVEGDPKFANTVRATNPRTYLLRRIRRSVALFVLGLVALLVGVVLNAIPALTVTLGILGFVIMLTAGLRGWTDLRRMSGRTVEGPRRSQAAPRRGGKSSIMERFEQRWNRRWDEHGG